MLFITGTDTGVGKTYGASYILNEASRHINKVLYYKVVQCGYIKGTGDEDIQLIKKLSSKAEVYSSYRLEYPGAPVLAADLEKVTIDEYKIKEDLEALKKDYEFIITEGAGGLAVPLKKDFLFSDLAKFLELPILIVARPDLGTINHSILTVDHARSKGLHIAGILMSQFSAELDSVVNYSDKNLPLHIKTAPQIIADFTGVEVYTDSREFIDKNIKTILSYK